MSPDPSAAKKRERKRRADERAEQVEDLTRLAVEAGLFRAEGLEERPEAIYGALDEARSAIDAGDLTVAFSRLNRAERLRKDAEHERGLWWRLWWIHSAHLFGYHVLVLAVVLWFALRAPAAAARQVWVVPISVFAFGAMGGVLRGLYWLNRKVQRRRFRPQFTLPQVAAPWIGGLFGALVYLLILGGVFVFGSAGGSPASGAASPGQLAAATLAGYSWEWALERLDRFISMDGSGTPAKEKAGGDGADDADAREEGAGGGEEDREAGADGPGAGDARR